MSFSFWTSRSHCFVRICESHQFHFLWGNASNRTYSNWPWWCFIQECQMLTTKGTGNGKYMGKLLCSNVPKPQGWNTFSWFLCTESKQKICHCSSASSSSPEDHVQSSICFCKSNNLMNSLAARLVIYITGMMNLIKFGASWIGRWDGGRGDWKWMVSNYDGWVARKQN